MAYYLKFVKPEYPFIPNFEEDFADIFSNSNTIRVPEFRPWTRRCIFTGWMGEDGKEYYAGDVVTISSGDTFRLHPMFLTRSKESAEWTQTDLDRINGHLKGTTTLTQKEIEKYDVNGDGVINITDLVLASQKVAAEKTIVKLSFYPTLSDVVKVNGFVNGTQTPTWEEFQKYDINGDGEVDIFDLVYLSQKVADDVSGSSTFLPQSNVGNCTIRFRNTYASNEKYLVPGENIIEAAEVLLEVVPTSDEYKFDGWYSFNLGSKIADDAVVGDNQSIRIAAKCVKLFTLTYNAGNHIVAHWDAFAPVTAFSVDIPEYRPFCRTALFEYWSGSDGNTYNPGDNVTPAGDIVLTAVWTDLSFVPTASDVTRINDIVVNGNATQEEIEKYDVNGDGEVDIFDLVPVAQYVADSVAYADETDIPLILNIENGSVSGINKLTAGENLADILRIGVVVTPDTTYSFDGWYYDRGLTQPVGANDVVTRTTIPTSQNGQIVNTAAPVVLYGKMTKTGTLYNVVFDFGDTFCKYPEHAFDMITTDTPTVTIPDVWPWSRKRVFSGWVIDSPNVFTQDDVDRIEGYLRGTTTLTQEEIDRYDLNGDGVINITDLVLASQYAADRLMPGDQISLQAENTTLRATWGETFDFYPTASDVATAEQYLGTETTPATGHLDINNNGVIDKEDVAVLEHKTEQNPTADYTLTVTVSNGSVRLRDNGGLVRGENLKEALDVLPILTFDSGYEFAGWYKNSARTTPVTGSETVTGNTRVYVKTSSFTRVLRYDMGGVVVADLSAFGDATVSPGGTISVSGDRPRARGYTLRYWRAPDGSIYNPGDQIGLSEALTVLTAVWFKIPFEPTARDVLAARDASRSADPTINAGTQKYDINGNGVIDDEDVRAIAAYVADWAAIGEYTLTVHVSRGSATVSPGRLVRGELLLGAVDHLVTVTMDDGYDQDGWYYDDAFTRPVGANDLVSGNVTVYMKSKLQTFRSVSRFFGDIFKKIRDFIAIANCEDPEFERKNDVMTEIKREMHWTTAESWGLQEMERILDISTPAETVEDRRFSIRARLGQDTPYSPLGIVSNIERITGDGTIFMDFDVNAKTATVRVGLNALEHIDDVKEALYRMMPAHILWTVQPLYNTHQKLRDLDKTHDALDNNTYTYTDVREHYFG